MEIALFSLGTIFLAIVSRKSLLHPRSHGFYRFFAWEILLAMLLINVRGWFRNPLAWHQLVSWILLIISMVLVIQGIRLLHIIGSQDAGRSDPSLHLFPGRHRAHRGGGKY